VTSFQFLEALCHAPDGAVVILGADAGRLPTGGRAKSRAEWMTVFNCPPSVARL